VKREFDVAKASRKERKRIDRRDRRKRQAQEQQRAVVFVTVFRKLALAGWLGDEFVEIARLAGGRDNLLSIVESTCAAHSQQPGDDDSWSSLVWTARDHGAPESVLDSLATKWSLAHPESKEARRFRLWYRGRRGAASRSATATVARRSRGSLRVEGPTKSRDVHRLPPSSRRTDRDAHLEARGTTRAGADFSVPLTFHRADSGDLFSRLVRGPHDDLAALHLAQRGVEILAEDRFDRLLGLAGVRGVDHLDYQTETVMRVLKKFRGRVLLADEVGLGKTIEACLVLREYLVRGQVKRALVLTPAALVGQWQSELEDKFAISAKSTQAAEFRADPVGFWKGGPVLIASLALARQRKHRAAGRGDRPSGGSDRGGPPCAAARARAAGGCLPRGFPNGGAAPARARRAADRAVLPRDGR